MNHDTLRLLICTKLDDGRLPHNGIRRFWGGGAAGEMCDGCDLRIDETQLVMEGVSIALPKRALQFHVECFHLWDAARDVPGR